ncbi:MAG: hypothetical protein HYY32_01655 [Chloroflexi bacterium]|nr:hypothetical protein [Chloroflexota bacterium]
MMESIVRRVISDKRLLGALACATALMLVLGGTVLASAGMARDKIAIDLVTSYQFDPVSEKWVKTENKVPAVPNPDGAKQPKHHTVIINLKANDPVKTIDIRRALVMGGVDPIIEIAGQVSGVTNGFIAIGNLILDTVDAKELEIKNTEAVDVTMTSVAAKDNELDVDIEAVNVVRVARGGPSVLNIGHSGSSGVTISGDLTVSSVSSSDTGVRVDRIRILGPQGSTGFVENLLISNSSAFGKIKIQFVKVQNLILNEVTLDNNVP